MSRNGTGTYNLPAGNPVSTGTTISSSWANSTLSDIGSALTGSIASDGQTTPTANLPMGTYAHTGVGNATARTMYASAGQVQDSTFTYLTSVAGTNAITALAPIVMTAYAIGQVFRFIAAADSTGAVTININSIGVKSVVKTNGSPLVSGDIVSGSAIQVMYDGTKFQLISNINSASSNVNLGYQTLQSNTTGSGNTALGYQTLYSNTTGEYNASLGYQTLYSNITGFNNVAIGYQTLYSNITGYANVGIGSESLLSNISGNNNTALGNSTLTDNTTGSNNTALGNLSLANNTTGNNSISIGNQSLLTNTTGSNNIALGYQTLYNNTTGFSNAAVGYQSIYSNIGGAGHTALGYQTLYSNTTGSVNTALGYQALKNNTTGSGNTAINPMSSAGVYAPVFDPTTQNDRLCLGSTSITNAYVQVAWTVVSDARDKTDFAPVPYGLDFVTKLKPTAYRYKINREDTEGHGVVRYGFKAQDVLELEGDNPVIVDAEDSEKLKFNDQSMIAVLVNAIQELKFELDKVKSELKAAKG